MLPIQCAMCQSNKIIPTATIHEMEKRYERLMVTVYTNPKAVFAKGGVDTWVTCAICGDCGHIMLYAEDPQALWQAYQAQQKS